LPAEDVCATTRPPCTTAARALVDAASWANSDREALTVIAMCFQQRLVGLDDVLAVWQRLPRSKRRRLVLTAAQDAAGGAHSLGELEVLGLVRRAGLPAPSQQRERVDSTGRRRYLDFYWEQWHLHVEIDGAHHLDAARARADAARQNALWISGDRVLRFPAWAVRHDPAAVIAQIRAALIAAGWRG
jgi:hypothetical protein